MSKLDWSKAGRRNFDPARVIDVGDYGILSDRLAGRKGNLKVRRKAKKKKAAPNGAGLTSAASAVRQGQSSVTPGNARKNQNRRGKKNSTTFARGSGGLTIPELVARAEKKVTHIRSEIGQAERKLERLRSQLASAERQLKAAQDTPRRSTLGKALHETLKAQATDSG